MEKIKLFIFLFTTKIFINCIIVIPFKTLDQPDPLNFTIDNVIRNWSHNIIYSNASIGTPSQKINFILNSNSFSSDLFQHMCDIPSSSYNSSKSSTFIKRQSVIYYPMVKAYIIEETIYFNTGLKTNEIKPFHKIKMIYSDNKKEDQPFHYEYHDNTCINFGLILTPNGEIDKNVNLINQLAMNHKESYDISIKYTSDKDGVIVIGAEPHVYDNENYSEKNYRLVGAEDSDLSDYRYWYFNFDEIFFSYRDKLSGNMMNEKLNKTKKIKIKFDLGIIYGSSDYKDDIKNIFFDDLIKKGICWEKIIDNGEVGYYCDKKSSEDIIKNDFPTLYFKMNQFDTIFELNYKDLFREKDDKIYFLVFFVLSPRFYFEVGNIFLKKYFFTFNQDSKSIGYYIETKKPKEAQSKICFLSTEYFIILLIALIIVFSTVGYFVGRIAFNKMRRKRRNELDDIFEYSPQEEINENEKNESNSLGIKP